METNAIKNLSTKEKIILMNSIWESLENEKSEITSPKWHEDVLKDRKENIENGNVKVISLHELRKK